MLDTDKAPLAPQRAADQYTRPKPDYQLEHEIRQHTATHQRNRAYALVDPSAVGQHQQALAAVDLDTVDTSRVGLQDWRAVALADQTPEMSVADRERAAYERMVAEAREGLEALGAWGLLRLVLLYQNRRTRNQVDQAALDLGLNPEGVHAALASLPNATAAY